MPRVLVLLLLLALVAAPLPAQALSALSAYDASPSPFIRTEMVTISLTGVEPFRPVTLFMGSPGPPLAVPGVQGLLEVDPGTLAPFGLLDGLGIFGGGFFLRASSTGTVSFTVRVPEDFGAPGLLPAGFMLQAIVLQNPLIAPNGELFAFSNGTSITVVEPGSSPQITALSIPTVPEGTPTTLVISGTGLLPEATVLPEVIFVSTCNPGSSASATDVQLIAGPGGAPALQVTTPATVGGATTPPATNSGPVLVGVRFSGTGLYPNNPGSGDTITAPAGFGDPTFLAYQTSILPQVGSISPKANLNAGGCTVTISGSGFLECASVLFDAGGAGELPGVNVTVISENLLVVDPPPMGPSLVGVSVRNIDHHPSSPRQSPLNPPVTDFAYFAMSPMDIAVTAVSPSTVVEGLGGALLTVTGTCPQVGGYSALDPQSGATTFLLGSTLGGIETSSLAPVISVLTGPPGVFTAQIQAPSLPPGLNPSGLTSGGRGNAGPKHVQVVAPACLNPGNAPHLPFASIPAAESGNLLVYLAQNPPVITSISPNNCGRADGQQAISIHGSGFFTNDTVLGTGDPALGPAIGFLGTLPPQLLGDIHILSDTLLTAETPDLSALMLLLPFRVDTAVLNPDFQLSSSSGAADDFHLYPSLSSTTANTFPLTPPYQVVDTGPLAAPQVFTFTSDLTLPAALLVQAQGEAPLIIRCRGDVTIDGVIDLSGSTILGPPYLHPAGGAAGGMASGPLNLGLQDPFQGLFGLSPFDPVTLGFYNGFGQGGFHAAPHGGGGGGGALALAGGSGQPGSGLGGPGGLSYGFSILPLPVLGSGVLAENFYPPGGSGGGAGGMGTPSPFNPGSPPVPPDPIGYGGSGGNGGGAVIIAADGIITVTGAFQATGQDGAPGMLALNPPVNTGGGGGGGSGGGLVVQALQGIRINASAIFSALGGAGGSGGAPGVNDGGGGSPGMIRLAIPAQSALPSQVLVIDPAALFSPAPDLTGY